MAVIADVFDLLLIQDDEVIATDTLVDANIEVTVAENDVRGGKGNQLLGVLHADRDINISSNDANFRYDFLAKQFGQDIRTGASVAWAMPKWYEVGTGLTIELENSPSAQGDIYVYNEEGKRVTGFTNTDKSLDFTAAAPTVDVGDKLEVRTYKYATNAETQEFDIDNKVFAKGTKVVLETIEMDESTEEVLAKIQYEFFNAIPTGAVSINTASERTAQSQPFNLRIVKPKTSTVVGVVRRIPVKP